MTQPITRKPLLGFTVFALSPLALAAVADIDTSFGSGGIITNNLGSAGERAAGLYVDSGNRIYVLSFRQRPGTTEEEPVITRYSADGQLDTSFGNSGALLVANPDSETRAQAIAVDAQERIVLASSDTDFQVTRYSAAGARDTTFGSGGRSSNNTSLVVEGGVVAVQANGRIVAGATRQSGDGSGQRIASVARYEANGAINNTFTDSRNEPGVRSYGNQQGNVIQAVRSNENGILLLTGSRASVSGGIEQQPAFWVLTDTGESQTNFPFSTDVDGARRQTAAAVEGRLRANTSGTVLYAVTEVVNEDTELSQLGTLDFNSAGGTTVAPPQNFVAPAGFGGVRAYAAQSNGKVVLAGVHTTTQGGHSSVDLALVRVMGSASLGTNGTPGPTPVPTPAPVPSPTPSPSPAPTPAGNDSSGGGGAFGGAMGLGLFAALRRKRVQ